MNTIYSINTELAGSGIGNVAYHAVSGINRHDALKKVISIGHKKTEIPESKIRNIRFPPKPPYFPRKYYYYLRNSFFDKLASRHIDKCDIFHGWNSQCIHSLLKAKKLGAKTVLERASSHVLVHEKLLREECKKWGTKPFTELRSVQKRSVKEYKIADYITVPSNFAYNSFLEYGFDKHKLIKIPFGVDTKRFKPIKKKDSTFRILFVGQISLRKGIPYILQAFESLEGNYELMLVGPIMNDIKNILSKYKNNKKIKIIGYTTDLRQIYNTSSIFVLPTIEEGSALVVYEAMASSLPVIVTENAGSIARNGKDGFITKIRDEKALQKGIQYFYDNPKEIKRMGKNARKRVEAFTWEKYGNSLVKEYKKIV